MINEEPHNQVFFMLVKTQIMI